VPKKYNARRIGIALGTPTGKYVWHQIMNQETVRLRSAVSALPEAASLEGALENVWDGRHLEGYLQGIEDGYRAARRLLRDKGNADIVSIVGRHPNWSTRQICHKIDTLKKPPTVIWPPQPGLWEDAIKNRDSKLTRNVEKYISRIRIASVLMSEARGWKRYMASGILP